MTSQETKETPYLERMIEAAALIPPTYLPTHDNCYVCGQTHPRGLRLRFYAGAFGQVHARFKPAHTLTCYDNVVHGGVISALLDELLGWPIALQTGRVSMTSELTVRFARPVLVGRTYLATAYPGTSYERYWEGEGDIRDLEGTVYAKARGTYLRLSAARTAEIAQKMTYRPGDAPVFRAWRPLQVATDKIAQGPVADEVDPLPHHVLLELGA